MTVRIREGAEPFAFDGGPVGFLLLHGFAESPASMKRIGEWLAARGHAVTCPRYPGHGTTWQQLGRTRWQDWVGEAARALKELDGRTEGVVLLGQGLGGAIALHLAARYPDAVKAVVLVNPYVKDRRLAAAPAVKTFVRSVRGRGGDIKKEGEEDGSYDRLPMSGLAQVSRFLRIVRRELPRVHQPVLLFRSQEDHVVPHDTAEVVIRQIGTEDKEVVDLPNSYHVATLDHDAELIFEGAHEFAESKVLLTPG